MGDKVTDALRRNQSGLVLRYARVGGSGGSETSISPPSLGNGGHVSGINDDQLGQVPASMTHDTKTSADILSPLYA